MPERVARCIVWVILMTFVGGLFFGLFVLDSIGIVSIQATPMVILFGFVVVMAFMYPQSPSEKARAHRRRVKK